MNVILKQVLLLLVNQSLQSATGSWASLFPEKPAHILFEVALNTAAAQITGAGRKALWRDRGKKVSYLLFGFSAPHHNSLSTAI